MSIKDKFIVLEHKEDSTLVGITLTNEKYKGIIYTYGSVNFNVEDIVEKDEIPELNFEYTVLNNEHDYDIEGDPEIKELMGQILVSIIMETIESEQSGNGDSEGLDI